jgi:hypothetical protein
MMACLCQGEALPQGMVALAAGVARQIPSSVTLQKCVRGRPARRPRRRASPAGRHGAR